MHPASQGSGAALCCRWLPSGCSCSSTSLQLEKTVGKQLGVVKSSKTAGNALASELKQSLASDLFLSQKPCRQSPTKALPRARCTCGGIEQIAVFCIVKSWKPDLTFHHPFLQLGVAARMRSEVNTGTSFSILQPPVVALHLQRGPLLPGSVPSGGVALLSLSLGTRVAVSSRRP